MSFLETILKTFRSSQPTPESDPIKTAYDEWARNDDIERDLRHKLALSISAGNEDTAAVLERIAEGKFTCRTLIAVERTVSGYRSQLGRHKGMLEYSHGRTLPTDDELRLLLATEALKKTCRMRWA